MDEKRHAIVCPHCATSGSRRLGECAVCGRVVCEHCGNMQLSGGNKRPVHRECLRHHGDSFKMIKFVR